MSQGKDKKEITDIAPVIPGNLFLSYSRFARCDGREEGDVRFDRVMYETGFCMYVLRSSEKRK